MVGWLIKALGALLLVSVGFLPAAANAREEMRSACSATTVGAVNTSKPEVPPVDRWVCDQTRYTGTPPVAWLFFTPEDFSAQRTMPTHFVTDIGRFESLTLIAMGPDGPLRSRSYRMADVSHFVNGPKFALPMPDMLAATGLVVAIEKPWTPVLMSQARLQARHGEHDILGWSDNAVLALALLAGFLAVPLIYNAAFYRLLRERFVLWMLANEMALLALVVVSSGLYHRVIDISMAPTAFLSAIAKVGPLVFATGYFVTYLERPALSDFMRKVLMRTALATAIVGVVFCLVIPALRPMGSVVLLIVPLPLIAAIVVAMVRAWQAGSRAIRGLIATWAPLMAATAAVVVRGSGLGVTGHVVDATIYAGILFHAMAASIAVIHRMEVMRRERERVNARLDALSNLIDLDPLTGIFNRRALEQRFAELRSSGFHALAVVDLDHFKRINDRFGHTTGDRVLQEVAAVLASDKDALAFRMGGEEFVVMLKGPQMQQRAEQLRRAITIRVANEVDGIDTPVTASMGLVESPPGGASTMRQLYGQADRLLYEAKYSGRNRLISERIQVFEPPSRQRRLKDRRAAERRAG
ncbi:diguanylate cyclase [Croceicoccus ponticola]|uniref:diguanylate cyclase n=1 Tax=Croceicoccus ponticola TaxID=2217664 RepID=A0A437GYQ5_9SPHN|nr:diguanylate cyclase [Croceicoccus ponticola]RVQ67786.1 diguanylate cyclase [Croceicoccus ponticola]